jgi:hypothetical protein
MIKEICGEEMTYVLNVASHYMLDIPRRTERVDHRWKPYKRYADQQLRAYLEIIDEVLEKTFGGDEQRYEITKLHQTHDIIFRLEMEITNFSRTVACMGEIYHPMLFFKFDTHPTGVGKVSFGFNTGKYSEGILIHNLFDHEVNIEPHQLPEDWSLDSYQSMANNFQRRIEHLLSSPCAPSEMREDVVSFNYVLFKSDLSMIIPTILTTIPTILTT